VRGFGNQHLIHIFVWVIFASKLEVTMQVICP